MRVFQDERRTALAALLAAAIAMAPTASVAAESTTIERPPAPLRDAITRVGADASPGRALALPTVVIGPRGRSAVQKRDARASAQTDLGSPSFFKTPAGILTLVAVGVGVGVAVYSTRNDRVKSPGR